MSNKFSRYKVAVNVTILAMMWVIFFLIEQYTPFQLDNPLFERTYLDCTGDEVKFSWGTLVDYIVSIRHDDNWRLGNILAPLTTLFMPKWLFSALTAAAFAGSAWLMARLVGRDRVEPFSLTYIWAGMIVFLPYSYTLFVGDYALNYIFGGALSLLLVTLLFNHRDTWRYRVAIIVMSVIVGWWHEGFALSIVAGLLACVIAPRRRVSGMFKVSAVVLTVVSLGVFVCPGMIERIATREAGNSAVLHNLPKVLICNCLTVALLAILMIGLMLPGKRGSVLKRLGDPMMRFLIGSAVAGLAMSFSTAFSARTAYWPQICSMVALLLWFFPRGYECNRVTGSRVKYITLGVLLSLCTLQGWCSVSWCKELNDLHDKAMAEVLESPYNTAYCDLIYPEDIPAYCFRMPAAIEWVEQFNFRAWNDRYFKLQKSLAVVPSALKRDLIKCDADSVGTAPVVMRVGDALFAERIETEYGADNVSCNITLNDGTRMDGHMALLLDFCDPEGHPFTYIKPFGLRGDAVKSIEMILD